MLIVASHEHKINLLISTCVRPNPSLELQKTAIDDKRLESQLGVFGLSVLLKE
jgi:hypothetical protein